MWYYAHRRQKMIRLGYACINMELQETRGIQCSRSMIRRTFDQKGISYASQLALQNCRDLVEVVKWNNVNEIKVFRITSCLFPWASEYNIDDLPDIEGIAAALAEVGVVAAAGGQRLSLHPGPFNILASETERVVQNCITDLKIHGKMMDMMLQPENRWAKINIHVGAAKGHWTPGAETSSAFLTTSRPASLLRTTTRRISILFSTCMTVSSSGQVSPLWLTSTITSAVHRIYRGLKHCRLLHRPGAPCDPPATCLIPVSLRIRRRHATRTPIGITHPSSIVASRLTLSWKQR